MKRTRTLCAAALLVSGVLLSPAAAVIRIGVDRFRSGAPGVSPDVADALTEMFITELSNSGSFQVYERTALEKVAREQRLSMSGLVSESTLVKVGRLAGVEWIITGAVTQFDEKQTGGVLPIHGFGLAEGDSSPFYADGIVYFRSTANNGYSGDLEIALIPEWFRTDILKETLDKNGILIESSKVTEMEKFALLFEFDGDVRCIRHVLYNCTASRPSIESETKEDTIEPGTEKLSLTADPREDGLVKSRTGDTTSEATYNDWYKQVYIPVEPTAAG